MRLTSSEYSGYYGKLYNNLKKAIEDILPYIAQKKVCSDKSERFRWWPKQDLIVYHHRNGAHVGLNREELANAAAFDTVDLIANILAEEFLVAAASMERYSRATKCCHVMKRDYRMKELNTVSFSFGDFSEECVSPQEVTYKSCFSVKDPIDFKELKTDLNERRKEIKDLNESRKEFRDHRIVRAMAFSIAADIEGTANAISEQETALPEKQIEKFSDLIIYEANERGLDLDKVFKDAYFSKSYKHQILNDKFNNAGKDKTIMLALALHMTPDEARAFIGHEGHAFSPIDKRDQLFLECLENKNWDILAINECLFKMGLMPLPV